MFIKKPKISPGDLIIRNSTKKIYYVLDKKLYKDRQIILIVSDDYRSPVWDFENLYAIIQKNT
jgi:hypothetical protein